MKKAKETSKQNNKQACPLYTMTPNLRQKMEKAWKKRKFIQWLLINPEVNGRTALKWT